VTQPLPHDAAFMAHALALSRRGLGRTWPNPTVGAVITTGSPDNPIIVGRGFTQDGGRPHGEAMALEQAGDAAAGGTLYVTLEPCSHRTVRGGMPCLERTIRAGIIRVVSAMDDPNPMIAGLGHALLRAARIPVLVGPGGIEAAAINRGHVLRVTEGRPFVTLKIARTADGFAGGRQDDGKGSRVQISCEQASHWLHLQRAMHDAIMVGVSTVIADDPQLNVRLAGLERRSPVRVVLDSQLRLPTGSKLARTAHDIPTWIITSENASVANERALVAQGVEVMRVGQGADGHVDLAEALKLLATRGITRVFSEGGPTVGAALARLGLADEILISTSPDRLGHAGVVAIQPGLKAALDDPACYRHAGVEMIGDDRLMRYDHVASAERSA
jgi:diaminohydroxyphosphoribosylaminopyrimidine deaminase / 5-amino-6-(5-phosphoribosylamino)uracil reductase